MKPIQKSTVDSKLQGKMVDGKLISCKNCESKLSGRYCSECGQDSIETIVPLKVFFKQGIEDILSFDFRYPNTLKALLIPGRLTEDYLKGQRIRYAPPLKFVFNVSILLFVVIALTAPESSQVKVNSDLSADLGYFAREYALLITFSQLLILPVWAFLLNWLFRKQRPLYLNHLIFALHYHTAVSVSIILSALLFYFFPLAISGWISVPLLFWIYIPYLIVSFQRVYGAGWWRSVFYGLVGLIGYLTLLLMVSTLVGAIALGVLEGGISGN